MVVCTNEGSILAANRLAAKLLGRDPDQLVGGDAYKLIPGFPRRNGTVRLNENDEVASCDLPANTLGESQLSIETVATQLETADGPLLCVILRQQYESNAAEALHRQAEFEQFLSNLSANFINLEPERVDSEITAGLCTLAEVMGLDRVSIAVIDGSGELVVTHSWAQPGTLEFPARNLEAILPWLAQRIRAGEPVFAGAPEELPQEALAEKQHMASLGLKSSMALPLRVGGKVIGGIACSRTRVCREWNTATISRFQAVAHVFADALARKQADEKLQRAYIEIHALKEQLELENSYLRQEIKLEQSHHAVVGNSAAMREVLKKAEQVAGTDSTVLVLGETGTGKELIARTIHEMSGRCRKSMVKANCAALPSTLIESELFGREKGAYTGALAREVGRFELADQSTIFLDEIGEIPIEAQAKLLRVLQEGEFERLGCSKTIKVNVRVIAASNRDLLAMVSEGKFREDLYYRLNVFPILVPPLRERLEDIPALVWHILNEMAPRMGRKIEGVHAGTMSAFQRYSWPGNIRELRNVIERNLILSTGQIFRAELLEMNSQQHHELRHLNQVECEYFRNVLQAKGWRIRGKGGAAETLGLKATTLEAKLKKLGISRPI
jgi:formate hydrogenlyase transcriptional activator